MRAILQTEFGGRDTLYVGETDDPLIKTGQVLIVTEASALNRADILQREGKYPPPKGESEILGLEAAGVILKKADSVPDNWRVGDRVMALLAGGGQAAKVAVDHRLLMQIPERLSFEEAAAIPEVFLTAYQTLFLEGEAKDSDTVLIHAGASGVGTAAIQLAKAAGLKVMVTASAPKHQICLDLGADLAIDYKNQDFAEEVMVFTEGNGVDLILDFIGAPYLKQNLKSLANEGCLILIAMMGGFMAVDVNLLPLLHKRLQIRGTTLRARTIPYKQGLIQAFTDRFWLDLEQGLINPIIDSVYPLEEIAAAHEHMESNLNVGKIIINVS
jgi:tumor protein p53-inducible protein 3